MTEGSVVLALLNAGVVLVDIAAGIWAVEDVIGNARFRFSPDARMKLDDIADPALDQAVRQGILDVLDEAAEAGGKVIFQFPDDPIREVLGSGRITSADEWDDIIEDIIQKGGTVRYADNGTMAYGPSGTKGFPGQISIDLDASLSALKHEYQHFLDDMESGWRAYEIRFENLELAYEWEVRAYQIEIEIAEKAGRQDIVDALNKNLLKEKNHIFYN